MAFGKRIAKSDGRPSANGQDAEQKLQTCLDLVSGPVAQPPAQASQEASLEIQDRKIRNGPATRPNRTPLAVENSVGKLTANFGWRQMSAREREIGELPDRKSVV